MRHHLHSSIFVAVAAVAAATPSQAAFVVDQVQLRRAGPDAVLELTFNTPVQFQRLLSSGSGNLVIASYHLVTLTNREVGKGSQLMTLDHLDGVDRLRLTDEADGPLKARRLVLQLQRALTVQVRGGRDNQHLEIVLVGQGGQAVPDKPVAPAPAAAPPVAAAPAAPAPPQAAAPEPTAPTAPTAPSVAAPDLGLDARAGALMESAQTARAAGQPARAVESLNALLELPPNRYSADAQELVGLVYLDLGQTQRARVEFETYLELYPKGDAAQRVREKLQGLPEAPPAPAPAPESAPEPVSPEEVSVAGSVSMTYYGGNGKLRSQEFQDSPIAGLPPIAGEPLLSNDRSQLLYNDVDVSWRRRTADQEQRFVFRDGYTSDLERPQKSKNRLSSLYFDQRSRRDGWDFRLGRQSPSGGGIIGRFDGAVGHFSVAPKVKLGAEVGVPADNFFDSRRHFYGLTVDGDRVIGNLGVGAFIIEQRIDGETDRRAVGLELRYFEGGASVFSQFDYDILMKGLNVATVQVTYVAEDNTVYNALYDRRSLATLALGNSLTFEDAATPGVLYRRIQDRLANTTVEALREQIKRITPMVTQAQVGVTRPVTPHWQAGASLQLSNTGAIPPVLDVPGFENGRPATGNIVSASIQLIGLNLYSTQDTHVFSATTITSPALDGVVLAYNNSSYAWEQWQLEPSLQYYRDRTPQGSHGERWTPGLRLTYRGWKRWAIESAVSYELGRATRILTTPFGAGATLTTSESANRVNYSLGARFEF